MLLIKILSALAG